MTTQCLVDARSEHTQLCQVPGSEVGLLGTERIRTLRWFGPEDSESLEGTFCITAPTKLAQSKEKKDALSYKMQSHCHPELPPLRKWGPFLEIRNSNCIDTVLAPKVGS